MDIPLLPDIVAIFCLSIGVLLVCHKVRLPPIVGLLITGVLCGPSALGLVVNVHAVELLAEIGVVLLMFTIGMELSGEELSRLKKPVFIGGTAQVLFTVAAFAAISLLVGVPLNQGIMIGFLAALSSTAIVLSILQQRAQSESPQGRLALSVLIFQDIAIVPMMLMLPFLAGKIEADTLSLALSAGRSVAILGGGWLLAKYVVPRVMALVVRTRSRELLLMSTLGLCLAIALGTASMGLSLSLGAFLAGLLLAESEYSLSVVEGILPFKAVFTSIFFISVGMLLDVNFLLEHLFMVVVYALAIIVLKALLALPAMLLLGYPARVCIIAAISLSQIGEFSFVLARSGVDFGLLNMQNYQMFLAGSILTMVLTPTMINAAPRLAGAALRLFGRKDDDEDPTRHDEGLKDHLIIVGFGVGGKYLARTARETGIPYLILEMNPDTVARFKDTEPIHHGDAARPLVLKHCGIDEARVLAVVISDPAAVRAAAALARKMNPKIHIVVRTRFLGEVAALHELGANDVIPEDFETSIEIFTRVLGHYLVPRQQIERFVESIRDEHYEMARDLSLHGPGLPDLAASLSGLEITACLVEEGAAVAGQSLADLNLRRDHGVTVVGIRRDGTTIAGPDGSEVLHVGDTVFLFAAAEALAAAMTLLRTADAESLD